MRAKALLLAAALLAAGGSGWGAGDSGWTDAEIDKKEKLLDELSAKRLAVMEAQYKAQIAFETQQWDERKAFEEKLVSERRSFLESLKGKPGNEQKTAFNEFSDKQANERKQFDIGQTMELQAHREALQKGLAETPKKKRHKEERAHPAAQGD